MLVEIVCLAIGLVVIILGMVFVLNPRKLGSSEYSWLNLNAERLEGFNGTMARCSPEPTSCSARMVLRESSGEPNGILEESPAAATRGGMRCCCGCIRALFVNGSARGWRRCFVTCAGSTGQQAGTV